MYSTHSTREPDVSTGKRGVGCHGVDGGQACGQAMMCSDGYVSTVDAIMCEDNNNVFCGSSVPEAEMWSRMMLG